MSGNRGPIAAGLKGRRRLAARFAGLGIEALVISHLPNLLYLFGFTGSTATALVTPDDAFLFLDSRYILQGQTETTGCVIEASLPSVEQALVAKTGALGIRSLAVEGRYFPVRRYELLRLALPGQVNLTSVNGLIEDMRVIKTDQEIAEIQQTLNLTTQAFDAILSAVKPGIREVDLASELEYQLRRRGARKTSFDTIVASGWRSAMPHGLASEKRVQTNEFIVFDFGAYRNSYASDMTRTIFLGSPTAEQRRVYRTVLEAVLRTEEQIRPGLGSRTVDKFARSHIENSGFGAYFGHGTGHGIGLEVHEAPFIAPSQNRRIRKNMVFTIEPGIYLPDKEGVRIEDIIRVKRSGCQVMTRYTKELIVL